jgi:hypothetical protein
MFSDRAPKKRTFHLLIRPDISCANYTDCGVGIDNSPVSGTVLLIQGPKRKFLLNVMGI